MLNQVACLSGVSCGGKTAVLKELDKTLSPAGTQLAVMVSDVTRDLRSDKEDFRRHVSREEYADRRKRGEYVQTIQYGKEYYSVRKCEVDTALRENKYVLVDCIPDGVRQFSMHYPTKAAFIFAWPRELCRRHGERGTPLPEMLWRLTNAETELRTAIASGLYELYINNTDLEKTKEKIVSFLGGEHVVSDPVDMEAYTAELREVLSELL